MKHTRHALLALSLTAAVTLSGCGVQKKATFEGAPSAATTTAAAPASNAPTTAPSESAETAATTAGDTTAAANGSEGQAQDLGEPFAAVTRPARVAGDPDATLRVDVYPLQRDGKVVTATFGLTVESSNTEERQSMATYYGGLGLDSYLVDTKNLNKHKPLQGSDGSLSSSLGGGGTFRPGQTFVATAVFAAPPADVNAMDVFVFSGAPQVKGVPVQ